MSSEKLSHKNLKPGTQFVMPPGFECAIISVDSSAYTCDVKINGKVETFTFQFILDNGTKPKPERFVDEVKFREEMNRRSDEKKAAQQDWLTPMQALAHKILEDQRIAREQQQSDLRTAMEEISKAFATLTDEFDSMRAVVAGAVQALYEVVESGVGRNITTEDGKQLVFTPEMLEKIGVDNAQEAGRGGPGSVPGGSGGGSRWRHGMVRNPGAPGSTL